MYLLRLTQSAVSADRHRVELALEGDGLPRVTAVSEFDFSLAAQQREDLRWYLEDYLQYPLDPAPKIAARIEQRMESIGKTLFQGVFNSDEDARDLWATLRGSIDEARIEVVTGVTEATAIPWELIRDPKTDVPLALRAKAFIRSQPNPAQRPFLPKVSGDVIRILLVICRPGGSHDVPFRSVASRLIKALGEDAQKTFELHVLRPPSFERLATVLRRAKLDGRPYHVVHFDGHGVYGAKSEEGAGFDARLGPLSSLLLASGGTGKHGFLLFERPSVDSNSELVSGKRLASLLAECHVPVLVLNACRSAHADPPPEPEHTEGAEGKGSTPHERVRALGSLAQEVMDAGVAGVVAMRYNVYVVTAAQFVADLYTSLVEGDALGVAVSNGRKQLAAQPLREISLEPRELQDWVVPIVYEAAPVALFERPAARRLSISVGAGDSLTAPERLDKELPPRPEVGFFGRDEALLALDRAFDSQKIVLLHAYAGSGKTSTAAEFARWYWRTGGIDGPVLFTSFEQYKPLGRVLDHFGDRFGPALAEVGVQWLALKDEARRNVALDVMRQIPVLWIWDNVETIAGFPAGTTSAWQPGEQVQLKEFLRAASETQAKFLLTSRREEHEWLGELPAHIAVSGMPLQERVQLARALAKRYGRQLSQLGNWRSLFEFTGGNPLTITVVVGQALRQGLQTTKQLEDFVAKLRAGSASLEDDESQGRERSLGASLSYGFKQNFSAQELKILALLHLFQGMVDARVLSVMANLNQKSGAPAIPVLSSQEVDAVLERAAEIGMLTPTGNRMFLIHPALPWYFRTLFESSYSDPLTVTRNYVEAIAELGSYFRYVYDEGQRNLLFGLRDEEQNLLHALALARANGWWEYVAPVLRVLRRFYEDSGRQLEYFRLLAEALPDFIGLKTDEPLPGREAFWKDITGLRANQASRVRDFGTSERLYKRLIAKARQEAAESLKKPVESWDESDKDAVGSLAYFLNNYGNMLWFAGRPDCVEPTEESVHLFELLNDPGGVASSAFDLGHAYMDFPQIYDLSKAEYWYGKRLEIERQRKDPQGIAMAMHELGQTAYRRFQEARQKRQGADEMLLHLNRAIEYASQALRTMPEQAIGRTNQIHHLLGNIYDDVGQLELALPHYQKTIEFSERQGDTLYAAKARREMARAYLKKGRLDEAFEYALAALRDVESFNGSAPEDLKRSQDLVREIQRIMSEKATV